jgi:hypothetical protein
MKAMMMLDGMKRIIFHMKRSVRLVKKKIESEICLKGSINYFLLFFYYLICEAIGTVATPGLLCQPRVIVKMIVEKQMECRLAGETKVLGENLPQCHFCPSQNPT